VLYVISDSIPILQVCIVRKYSLLRWRRGFGGFSSCGGRRCGRGGCWLDLDMFTLGLPDPSFGAWDIRLWGVQDCQFGLNNFNLALGGGGFCLRGSSLHREAAQFLNGLKHFCRGVGIHFSLDFHR